MNTVEQGREREELTRLLSAFKPITLKEMESVQLMSRFDMKYVFRLSQLPAFLKTVAEDYQVLLIDGLQLFRYENQYFDTASLKSYHDHHNSRSSRYKIRYRRYLDNDKCFLEVKQKINTGLTKNQGCGLPNSKTNFLLLKLNSPENNWALIPNNCFHRSPIIFHV